MTWWSTSPQSSLPALILFFITSAPSNIWYQQVIVLITWETEELPDLLDTKHTGSHTLILFNSNGSERKTTSNHKHKHTYLLVKKKKIKIIR